MAKKRTIFCCTDCGANAPKWVGRCPVCDEWNTLVEEVASDPVADPVDRPPVTVQRSNAELTDAPSVPRPTQLNEVDRVLGGGLTPGSVTLLGGAPGAGKSTLLLQVAHGVASNGARVLYACGEEPLEQVRARADRLGTTHDEVWLAGETAVEGVLAAVDTLKPDVLVVDSVQSAQLASSGSAPGSVASVRDVTQAFVSEAKQRNIAVVLVGHVTKDGGLAGPRVLEHMVDTVLELEGDRHHGLRILRAIKHRFGSTAEIGLFTLGEKGMAEVHDPSNVFLSDRLEGVSGSVVVPTLEGRRPLLVEIQALVAPSPFPEPRFTCTNVDRSRVAMIAAVLSSRAGVALQKLDVYASAAGGVRVTEPAADLALALALLSAVQREPMPEWLVACGELGLGGEVRGVRDLDRRLHEAARMGFEAAIVPVNSVPANPPIPCLPARSLTDAAELIASAYPQLRAIKPG